MPELVIWTFTGTEEKNPRPTRNDGVWGTRRSKSTEILNAETRGPERFSRAWKSPQFNLDIWETLREEKIPRGALLTGRSMGNVYLFVKAKICYVGGGEEGFNTEFAEVGAPFGFAQGRQRSQRRKPALKDAECGTRPWRKVGKGCGRSCGGWSGKGGGTKEAGLKRPALQGRMRREKGRKGQGMRKFSLEK
jgi:hypothetical protein